MYTHTVCKHCKILFFTHLFALKKYCSVEFDTFAFNSYWSLKAVNFRSWGHLSEETAPPDTTENRSLAVGVRLALPRGAGSPGSPSILR